MSTPVVKRKKSVIVLAWLVPIISFFISFDMIKDYLIKQGNELVLYTTDVKSLDIKKSHIQYKGIIIGDISKIQMDPNDLNRFQVIANLYSNYDYFLKEGTKFWIVTPSITSSKIENLDNIITGNYIEALPSTLDLPQLKKLPEQTHFTMSNHHPTKGEILTLNSFKTHVSKGCAILYKGMNIGEVIEKSLTGDANISYSLLIDDKYLSLVGENTYFYKVAPIKIDANLSNISFEMLPLKNFLNGAVELIIDPVIVNKNRYTLYENKEELYTNDTIITLKVNGNFEVESILKNNKQIGKVTDSNYDIQTDTTTLKVSFLEKEFYNLYLNPQFKLIKQPIDLENITLKSFISKNNIILTTSSSVKKELKLTHSVKIIDELNLENALEIRLINDTLSQNEKIYFKGVEVGVIKNIVLKDSTKVAFGYIYENYKNLIKPSTKFYKLKDISTDISLDGLKVDIGSLKQMIFGGISFTNDLILNDSSFPFYKVYDSLETLNNHINDKNSFDITLNLKDIQNIKKSSKLFFNNFEIGKVKSIALNDNDILITLNINNQYKKLFGKNSKIYLEGTRISLNGIKNLSSAIIGDKLHLVASSDGSFKDNFTLDSMNPMESTYQKGLRVVIKNKDAFKLSVGAPIYHKNVQIGHIEDIKLNYQESGVDIVVFIEEKYRYYIKNNSVFTRAININMDLGLFGSDIQIGTLEAILKGGLSVTSPKNYKRYAKNQDKYQLKEDKKE